MLILGIAVFGAALAWGTGRPETLERAVGGKPDGSEKDSAKLMQITPARVVMAPRLMTLCYRPRAFGPHEEPDEILVYANEIAIDYRRQHPTEFDYPIGSKFVKEKYPRYGDDKPDAATIMEKIATRGDVSDWNFSIVSLPDKTPLKPSGRESCAECHQEYKDTGFISSDLEAALKKFLKFE
jgi:hypothetical protein